MKMSTGRALRHQALAAIAVLEAAQLAAEESHARSRRQSVEGISRSGRSEQRRNVVDELGQRQAPHAAG